MTADFDREKYPHLNARVWKAMRAEFRWHELHNPEQWYRRGPLALIRMPNFGLDALRRVTRQLQSLGFDVTSWLPAFDGAKTDYDYSRNFRRLDPGCIAQQAREDGIRDAILKRHIKSGAMTSAGGGFLLFIETEMALMESRLRPSSRQWS
jgi:hypothetical protein